MMRTPLVRRWWPWMLLLVFLTQLEVMAHDVGLMTLKFQELGDNRYQLEYIAQPGTPESAAPPVLPEHLKWEQEPQLPGGLVRLVFGTDAKPLSGEDRIILPWKVRGVMVEAFWTSGETARRFFPQSREGVVVTIGELRAGTGSMAEAARQYTMLGVEHILTGWDHLLFVVGLLLLIQGWRMTMATITAFTVAHSLTLALGALGWLRMDLDLVDALVALSIVVLAVEILHLKGGHAGFTARKPWLIAFLFGLIHGMGFAWALADLGLPRQEIPQALVFFNLGVELGQVAVVGLWFALLAPLRNLSIRFPVVKATAYGLGIIASYLFLDRTLAMFS